MFPPPQFLWVNAMAFGGCDMVKLAKMILIFQILGLFVAWGEGAKMSPENPGFASSNLIPEYALARDPEEPRVYEFFNDY